MAVREGWRVIESLPIRRRLLTIAATSAAVSLLILTIAVVAYQVAAGGAAPAGLVIVAALVAALAGIAVAGRMRQLISGPLARLEVRLAEVEAARRKAEAASRAKSEFLANMSHELRQPLNAVIGFSGLMQAETLGPLGNPTYREYAADISFSGNHLLAIINDILDVVRYEAGRMELKEEAVEVEAVIAEALRLVAPQAAHAKVELRWSPPTPPLPVLRCDPVRLRQMLVNLLSNAVKFTRPGGSVTIVACHDGAMTLAVSDTGIGIRPEDLPRVLTPFGQVASITSRDQQGAGLGLPLTKALVERHGGRLDLDSTPDSGTTVRLEFPPERVGDASIRDQLVG